MNYTWASCRPADQNIYQPYAYRPISHSVANPIQFTLTKKDPENQCCYSLLCGDPVNLTHFGNIWKSSDQNTLTVLFHNAWKLSERLWKPSAMFSENSQNIFKNLVNVETINILIDQLVYHSAVGGRSGQSRLSVGRGVGPSISPSVSWSVCRSVNWLVGQSVGLVVGPWLNSYHIHHIQPCIFLIRT